MEAARPFRERPVADRTWTVSASWPGLRGKEGERRDDLKERLSCSKLDLRDGVCSDRGKVEAGILVRVDLTHESAAKTKSDSRVSLWAPSKLPSTDTGTRRTCSRL